jgi:hypothetical protein
MFNLLNLMYQDNLTQISESSITTSSSLQKESSFHENDSEQKNIFSSAMYAHLCHSETEVIDDDRNSKRFLQYYPQHQFHLHSVNSRSISPIKTFYSGTDGIELLNEKFSYFKTYFINLECLNNEYRPNKDLWPQEAIADDSLQIGMKNIATEIKLFFSINLIIYFKQL